MYVFILTLPPVWSRRGLRSWRGCNLSCLCPENEPPTSHPLCRTEKKEFSSLRSYNIFKTMLSGIKCIILFKYGLNPQLFQTHYVCIGLSRFLILMPPTWITFSESWLVSFYSFQSPAMIILFFYVWISSPVCSGVLTCCWWYGISLLSWKRDHLQCARHIHTERWRESHLHLYSCSPRTHTHTKGVRFML